MSSSVLYGRIADLSQFEIDNAVGAQVSALTEFGLKNDQWLNVAQWGSGAVMDPNDDFSG
jgi:hypothetical protein